MKKTIISDKAIVYENVVIGNDSIVEDYAVLGKPLADGATPKLVIGEKAHIRSHSIIYAGNEIGNNFQTGDAARIREFNKIGSNVVIGTHSVIETDCVVEDFVRIHSNCFIGENTVIRKNAWIGPNVITINTLHPRCPAARERRYKCVKGPIIGENAKIGAGSIIFPGVEIGENALIGAGSMVTKDIPSNSVAFGTPARVVKGIKELRCKVNLFKEVYSW